MNPSRIDASEFVAHESSRPLGLTHFQRYSLAALSVAVALGAALLLQHFHFREAAVPLLLLACATTSWYGGQGPAVLAVILSLMGFNYFFVSPIYSLRVAPLEFPYFIIFAAFTSLISWFATIRRRVDDDLRRVRDKLKIEVEERSSLLDLTHDSIFVRDMNSIITYWNQGAEEFYGWTPKEVTGKRSDELMSTVFPKALEQIRAELLETNKWEGELTRTKADGTQVIVASRWSLRRNQQEHPVAILETSNDITVRKRREEEIQALNQELAKQSRLLDQTHDSILFRNMNGLITYWNRGAQELYGWSPEEAIGKCSHELLRTILPAPIEDIDRELLRTSVWEGELKHTKADGAEVVVASRWSLSRDDKGQPIVMETNNDITERRRREDEIRKLNQELANWTVKLDASNKELEAFAYSISHDLRAPLRHMTGFAELLRKSAITSLNEKSMHYVMMILEASNRMGSLIDDLLGFSRISRAEAHNSTVRLEQLVQEAVAEVGQDSNERKIAWKIDPLPEWYGDRSMLRLALVNLISNAVKFTRTQPQPEIEIGCTEHKKDHVILFVKDNGVGFDMKYSNKLFGVFQRLHAQEAFEGTGIGLATVQRIAHRHGGRVWAEGIVDGGATFYFSLRNSRGAN
jgi:PAS domain S-box-containing protein